MFVGDQNHSSLVGGRSIAVPGELKGMWELHKKYGKLPWKELIQPIIKLCNKYKVSKNLAHSLKEKEIDIKAEPTLREVFIDPSTNSVWNAGEYLTDLDLAETLKIISVEGAEALYGNGEIGKQLLKDIKSFGGILTAEDLKDYQVRWSKPVTTLLRNGKMLYTMPSPGAGPLLIFIINLLKSFEFKHDTISYHRIIEAFKLAYARRSELGDPEFVESVAELTKNLTNDQYADNMRKLIDDSTTHNDIQYYGGNFFVPEDHGTAHISVLAPNGDAVSLTSTVNFLFGSMRRSKTGIILNDEMDDFSTPGLKNVYGIPPSEANFIAPGKRPVSSMTPTIIVNPDGQVNMVIGAAGGSKITASVAYSIIQHYFIKPNASIDDLFATKRLHHQLIPNLLNFEEGFDPEIINGLMELNHTMQRISLDSGFSALTGIINEHGRFSKTKFNSILFNEFNCRHNFGCV